MALHRFEKRLQFDPMSSREIIKLLTRIEECKGYWEAFQFLSPEYLARMKHAVIVSSSGSSTRIEGSHLSDDEVERLLRDGKVRQDKPHPHEPPAPATGLQLRAVCFA
ncbi:MAG: hypothetical protein AAB853_02600 [Patescibacteria group bacterium]